MAGRTVNKALGTAGRRAVDDAEKKEILDRLYVLWTTKGNRFLRLGQLVGNVYHSTDTGGTTLYYEEDYQLMDVLETAYRALNDRQAETPVFSMPERSEDGEPAE